MWQRPASGVCNWLPMSGPIARRSVGYRTSPSSTWPPIYRWGMLETARTLDSRYHSIQILLSSGISCVTVLKYCNFLLSSLGCSFKKLTLVVNNTALWQLQRRENVQIFALKCLSADTFLVLGLGLIREPKNEIPKSPQLNCIGVNHFPGVVGAGGRPEKSKHV